MQKAFARISALAICGFLFQAAPSARAVLISDGGFGTYTAGDPSGDDNPSGAATSGPFGSLASDGSWKLHGLGSAENESTFGLTVETDTGARPTPASNNFGTVQTQDHADLAIPHVLQLTDPGSKALQDSIADLYGGEASFEVDLYPQLEVAYGAFDTHFTALDPEMLGGGSILTNTFTRTTDDPISLSFDYDFLAERDETSEEPDFAFMFIDNLDAATGATVVILDDAFTADETSAVSGFAIESGWKNLDVAPPAGMTGDSYLVGFGVINQIVLDPTGGSPTPLGQSVLAFDNVDVSGDASASSTPEPSSLVVFVLGIAALVARGRRGGVRA